jgi:hypothetical protein
MHESRYVFKCEEPTLIDPTDPFRVEDAPSHDMDLPKPDIPEIVDDDYFQQLNAVKESILEGVITAW